MRAIASWASPPLPTWSAPEPDHVALLDRVDGVLLGDVRDLVPEHAGQLRFVLGQPQRAAGDVDDAAGRGERIHAIGIEHDELPVQVRPRARLRQDACRRSVTYFVTAASWKTPNVFANLQADLLADLALVRLRILKALDLVGLVGAPCSILPSAPPNCAERRGRGKQRRKGNDALSSSSLRPRARRESATEPTTSKIATAARLALDDDVAERAESGRRR